MKVAIGITRWFAAATSALGAYRSLRIGEATDSRQSLVGAFIGATMTVWFAVTGAWEMFAS
jgi:hypothetical protein